MQVLTGDIGGTKTHLALIEVSGRQVSVLHEARYRSSDFADFTELLAAFLTQVPIVTYAALGIAGPIQGRRVRTTNLPWEIDAEALCRRFDFAQCHLLNDLEATAYGLPALAETDFLTLQQGAAGAQGNVAIIAAGTGLGEAGLFWDGMQHHPYATEGGHVSFSPQEAVEYELLRFLQSRYGHVSWERIVSGMGIVDLHDFYRGLRGVPIPPALATALQQGDQAAAIASAASEGSDAVCVEVMEHFVRLYGAEAGNLALKTMSRGGLYVGGGIAPKLLPWLQQGDFIAAFLNKGRMRPLLEAVPVRVILNDRAALYGPALYAARPPVQGGGTL